MMRVCRGSGSQAIPRRDGFGRQCPACGLTTIPYPNGTVRRHGPLHECGGQQHWIELGSQRCLCGRLELASPPAVEPPPAPDLREAFRAGFLAHPDREAPSGFYWSFAPDTCMAADREPSAWEAWLASPPAVEGTRQHEGEPS